MVLTHPEVFTVKDFYVEIETTGDFCKGTTVADIYGISGKAPNISCIMDVNRSAFVDILVEAMKFYGEAEK